VDSVDGTDRDAATPGTQSTTPATPAMPDATPTARQDDANAGANASGGARGGAAGSAGGQGPWSRLAERTTDYTNVFARAAWREASMRIKTKKSETMAVGMRTEEAVTEAEVQLAAQHFSFTCDRCGTWKGVNERAVRQHQALHCPRVLHDGGESYAVERVVDDACTTRGRQYRVVWEGYAQHSWEPEWELLGNDFTWAWRGRRCMSTGRPARAAIWCRRRVAGTACQCAEGGRTSAGTAAGGPRTPRRTGRRG
jgi:hypothetical protein